MTQPIRTPANTSRPTASRNAIPIATQERAVMAAFLTPRAPAAAGTLQYNPAP